MHIEIRYFDDCPNWRNTEKLLQALLSEMDGIEASVELTRVATPEEATRLGFKGSPTVLIDGSDPWDNPHAPVGLSCRIYRTESGFAGSPPAAELRTALQQSNGPR